jgi:hypothetical protein
MTQMATTAPGRTRCDPTHGPQEAPRALERDRGARLIFTHDLDFRTATRLAPEAWYE